VPASEDLVVKNVLRDTREFLRTLLSCRFNRKTLFVTLGNRIRLINVTP